MGSVVIPGLYILRFCENKRNLYTIQIEFYCPCSQSAKGTPLLTLLKDPYILVAAGKLTILSLGWESLGFRAMWLT